MKNTTILLAFVFAAALQSCQVDDAEMKTVMVELGAKTKEYVLEASEGSFDIRVYANDSYHVEMTEEATTEITEEKTVEATEEVTTEKTEEDTVELTVEATAEQTEELVGHIAGTINPFCLKDTARLYLDLSIRKHIGETVFPGIGGEDSVVELTVDELEKLSDPVCLGECDYIGGIRA